MPSHVHHWILGPPSGGLIAGKCKTRSCKATRTWPVEPERQHLTAADIRALSQIRRAYNLENRLMVMGSYGSSYVYE